MRVGKAGLAGLLGASIDEEIKYVKNIFLSPRTKSGETAF